MLGFIFEFWTLDPQLLASLLTCLVGALLLLDLRHDMTRLVTARNVVLVGLFAWYLLEAMQAPSATRAFGPERNRFALLLVAMALWCFLYGYRIGRWRLFDGYAERLHQLDEPRVKRRLLFVAAAIGLTPIVLYGGRDLVALFEGILGMRKTWGGPLGRGALGDVRSAVLMLEKCVWGVSWIAVIYLINRRNPPGTRLFALALFLWTVLRAYGSGTRSFLFSALLVPCAALFWLADPILRRRLVYCVPILAALFFFVARSMVAGRLEGSLSYPAQLDYIGYEMYRELLFILDRIPEQQPYLLGQSYWNEVLSPIPRFLWPGKPPGFGITYASWHGYDALAGGPSLSPGIIGEMYANFGLAGIVLCSLFGGLVCRAWDRLREVHSHSVPVLMFYSAGLAVAFLYGRSATLAVLYPMIAAYLCLMLIIWWDALRAAPNHFATSRESILELDDAEFEAELGVPVFPIVVHTPSRPWFSAATVWGRAGGRHPRHRPTADAGSSSRKDRRDPNSSASNPR